MMQKTPYVGPFLRTITSIYDLFLLLGVWFAVGSFALWLNGGQVLHPALGSILVFVSGWIFFAFFWIKSGQTLGMQAWRIKLISSDSSSQKITLMQTFLRYSVNCGILALLGMPLLLIYVDQKRLAVNDVLSKTKLIRLES
ncbi:RDD family protein [Pseudomonadota bacterium]|nr:RDD family protein [Pseudomonadota bacterium]